MTQEDWPGEKKTQQKPVAVYEGHNESSLPSLEDDGIESLFESMDLANDLKLLSIGLVQGAEEEDLEELGRAAQNLAREKADRDRAMRIRSKLQSSNRGAGQSQASSPSSKGDRKTPQSSPPASQSRKASSANQSSSPPRAHGNASASPPNPSPPRGGTGTKQQVHPTKEQGQRSSTTKHFPSPK